MLIAFDPGASGACSIIHDDGSLAACWDMPTISVKVGKTMRNRIAPALLAEQIDGWLQNCTALRAIIEQVGPMPTDGPMQAFGLGRNSGLVEGVCAGLGLPITHVRPQVWKQAFALAKDKGAARMKAMNEFPAHAEMFKRVKDDGRAESALIGLYGWRTL